MQCCHDSICLFQIPFVFSPMPTLRSRDGRKRDAPPNGSPTPARAHKRQHDATRPGSDGGGPMVPMPAMVPGAKVMPLVENCGVLSGGGKGGDAKLVRYVALLRGINVGGRRVKMDRLREIFIGMGFTRVSTSSRRAM